MYIVTMNSKYINTYKNYGDACDKRDNLLKKFKNAKITIDIISK